MPVSEAKKAQRMKAVILMRETGTPERRYAVWLPPLAYR